MPEEFEGRDLSDAVFWGVDLSRARFRDVLLKDVRVSHAMLIDVEIDAFVDRVVINGVDVTSYVNEGDPWYPLRAMLRPDAPAAMRETWSELEHVWGETITRARRLTEEQLHESVDGEWSFVDTLRHLVFAIDKWFTVPILGAATFHPFCLTNTGSAGLDWPGLDRDANPSLDQILAVRQQRAASFGEFLDSLPAAELDREVNVLENGIVPIKECVFTVFEEEFHHNRYASRDLAVLEGR
jgi:uncharacterized damage-inducible protein DinB